MLAVGWWGWRVPIGDAVCLGHLQLPLVVGWSFGIGVGEWQCIPSLCGIGRRRELHIVGRWLHLLGWPGGYVGVSIVL